MTDDDAGWITWVIAFFFVAWVFAWLSGEGLL